MEKVVCLVNEIEEWSGKSDFFVSSTVFESEKMRCTKRANFVLMRLFKTGISLFLVNRFDDDIIKLPVCCY